MTTPVTDNTAYSIICQANWDACIIPDGEDPNSELLGKHMRRLNEIIVETITGEDGVRLWLLQDTPVVLLPNVSLYSFGLTAVGPGAVVVPKPMQVYDQYYQYAVSAGSTRRPVFKISRQEWDMLSTLVQTGPITQIFVDPQQFTLNVNTWLTPDANEALGQLHLVFQNLVTSFIGLTDTMNFPVEWALYLHWQLASEICQGQPAAVIARCDGKGQYYKQKLIDWDQEHGTSILPQPDQRMFQRRRFHK